jgi:hypothetical protein
VTTTLDPLALTPNEEDQMVAVLLLTGLASKDDVYRAANVRRRIEFESVRGFVNGLH